MRRELYKHPEVVTICGGKRQGKTILLRADMDALPIYEEADIDYRSETDGKMHGCGHDMHTAMLLGAAKILKAHEEEIHGMIKLEFQPAEEILQGSPDMISSGLLENPRVDAAVMIHVTAGLPLPAGTVMDILKNFSLERFDNENNYFTGKKDANRQ